MVYNSYTLDKAHKFIKISENIGSAAGLKDFPLLLIKSPNFFFLLHTHMPDGLLDYLMS